MHDQNKKGHLTLKIIRWSIYSICVIVVGIVILRSIFSATPKEVQNYIIQSPKINEAYMKLKDEFKIYQIDVSISPVEDDSLVIENVYYLEDAENLQILIKYKNSMVLPLVSNSESPFIAFLTVVTKNEDDEWLATSEDDLSEIKIWSAWGDASSSEQMFGKNIDRYQYIIYSFDNVKIDFDNTMVKLDVFINNDKERNKQNIGEIINNEDYLLKHFTVYLSIYTPKTIVSAKKFNFG